MSPSLALLLGLTALAGTTDKPAPMPAASPAKAPAARPAPVDTDACVYQGRSFQLSLRRPPQAAAAEDLLLTFDQGSKSVEARRLNEPAVRAWRLAPPALGPDWKPMRACRRVETVPAKLGRLLLLVPAAARSGEDHLIGIIYDARPQRVLDTRDLGPAGKLLALVGDELRLRQGAPSDGAGELVTDETGGVALPGGDRLVATSAGLRPVNPVLHVLTSGNRIDARPDLDDTWRALTAEAPEVAQAFPDAGAFGKAFGWGTKAQATAFRSGRTARGAACVQPVREGAGDEPASRWGCGAPPR